MRAWLLVLSLFLAGCADPAVVEEDSFSEDLELRATETTGVIRGVVIDSAIVPLAGATVSLQEGASTTTGPDGAFGFDGLAPGTYFVTASKPGFNATQTSVSVAAGVDRPDVIKLQLVRVPGSEPFVSELNFRGFLACGVAVVYTSVGCTTNGFLSDATDSTSIWSLDFERLPTWSQGELVWEDTQPASGQFIWQIVKSNDPDTPQLHIGYMETTPSPALTYIDTATIDENAEWIMENGVDYRFFGGPHELCPQHVGEPSVNRFGCGITIDQEAQVFIHHFYNFAPPEGWRFTADGAAKP